MIQRGQHFGFALKAANALGVAGDGVRQDLDRDIPFELRVARSIDFSHAAASDERCDLIGPQFLANFQGHARKATKPSVWRHEKDIPNGALSRQVALERSADLDRKIDAHTTPVVKSVSKL
jgi:hypothetical protein